MPSFFRPRASAWPAFAAYRACAFIAVSALALSAGPSFGQQAPTELPPVNVVTTTPKTKAATAKAPVAPPANAPQPAADAGPSAASAPALGSRSGSLGVPTTAEAGLPEYQAQAWNAIFAPKGTPAPIVAKLNAALVKALDDEGVKKRLLDLGSVIPKPAERTPESLKKLVDSEITKWSGVLKPLN